jgi:hypothetical protein
MDDLPDHWDDLEQELSALEEPEPLIVAERQPATMEIMEATAGLEEAETPAQLMDMVGAMDGIQNVVGVGRYGAPLAHSRRVEDKTLLDYVGQVADTSRAVAQELDFNGLEHVIMTHKTGDKLAVLVGPSFTLGLEIAAGATPAEIINKILPNLNRIVV